MYCKAVEPAYSEEEEPDMKTLDMKMSLQEHYRQVNYYRRVSCKPVSYRLVRYKRVHYRQAHCNIEEHCRPLKRKVG